MVVLERHELWGGLNSFYTLGGRRFDVGLHALTNFAPKGAKGAPLTRLLRWLGIAHEELRLGEQEFSEIRFPGARLEFTNDFNTQATSLYRLESGGSAYTFTQLEADDAREAFPCFDEPSFKIPWQMTLVVPEGDETVSNTPIEDEERAGGRKTGRALGS